jgi:hypothetical protein
MYIHTAKNMKQIDEGIIHISSKLHMIVYIPIMLDTLLLRSGVV